MHGLILAAGRGLGFTGGTGGGPGLADLYCVLFRGGKGFDGGKGGGLVGSVCEVEDKFLGGCGAGLQGVTATIRGALARVAVDPTKVG